MKRRISVHVRIRNKSKTHTDEHIGNPGKEAVWDVNDNVLYQRINDTTQLAYSCYQNIFSEISTEEIYQVCIKNIIVEAFRGVSCTIFAYGQTGSGKTYTMLGNDDSKGLILQSLKELIKLKDENTPLRSHNNHTFINYEVSYIEIYNENIHDLINLGNQIRIVGAGNSSFISNLTKIRINSVAEAEKIIRKCETRRKVSQTEFNTRSSRSHTIFQVHIATESGNSCVNMIDLAGSEKATDNLDRRKEGSYINKSLLALGTVVNKLIKNEYVSYRDSKLTRILQPSLDGLSNVISLCMISPDHRNILESINTLKFAARLSEIELQVRTERINLNIDKSTSNVCAGCDCCNNVSCETNATSMKSKQLLFENEKTEIEKNNIRTKEMTTSITFESMNDSEFLELERYKLENMVLKAENELFRDRIKNLEETIESLMLQSPSKRITDLFGLEKNMFSLQLEMIKRRNELKKELEYGQD